jgi:hypothetical protein
MNIWKVLLFFAIAMIVSIIAYSGRFRKED